VTPSQKLSRRLALARQIRATLDETLPTAGQRARWLRRQADSIEAEAERAKRPLERFDVAADDPQGAF
jgi:hypothetical protein